MAFGSIEITTLTRQQDYTAIKHNEDMKSNVDQMNIGNQFQRDMDKKLHNVTNFDNAEWKNEDPDARKKGKGEYHGDGGKNRKAPEQREKIVLNSDIKSGFDMKI